MWCWYHNEMKPVGKKGALLSISHPGLGSKILHSSHTCSIKPIPSTVLKHVFRQTHPPNLSTARIPLNPPSNSMCPAKSIPSTCLQHVFHQTHPLNLLLACVPPNPSPQTSYIMCSTKPIPSTFLQHVFHQTHPLNLLTACVPPNPSLQPSYSMFSIQGIRYVEGLVAETS